MLKKTWRTSALAIGAIGAMALSSCGFSGGGGSGSSSAAPGGSSSSGAAGGEAVSLTMLVPTYSDTKTSVDGVGTKARWEKVVADFQAKNPNIKITLQVESWDNLETVLKTKIQGNQAPDIYNGGAISGFVADDLLAKAEEITSPETLSNFQDSFNTNEKVGGTQYGLPLLASARALFYNKALLKEAGVEVPKTWDELLTAAKAVKEKTGNPGYGMPLGSEEAQAEAMIWSLGAGGGFGTESEITVDTPQNLEAFDEMKKFIDAGVTQSNPGSTQRTPMMSGFVQGKMGFVYALPPTVAQIKKENPSLEYGIAQPATKDGSAVTLGVADRLASFSKDQAKKDGVKKFMDYFFSDEVYVPFIKGESFLPTTKTGATAMSSDETLKPFLELLPSAKFYPTTNPAWAATDGALKSLTGQIEKSPSADVLKQIQAKADAAS